MAWGNLLFTACINGGNLLFYANYELNARKMRR